MTALVLLVVLALDIWAIYSLLTSPANTLAKGLWTVAILVFPLIGPLVWFLVGPKGEDVTIIFR